MLNTTISFKYMGKKLSWDFSHNLDEHGLSIDSAFINWSSRLDSKDKLKQSDFCKYVVSKDPVNLKCSILGK